MVASGPVQVQFAIDDEGAGAAITRTLLEEGLVACVQQVGPVTSRYRWDGRTEEAAEWLFLCKASAATAGATVARIAELHPYDTPEVITTPITGGLGAYLAWIDDETG